MKPLLWNRSGWWWHGIDLVRTLQCCHPLNPLRRVQLSTWLSAVDDIDIVQNTRLNDHHSIDTPEGVAIAVESRSCCVSVKNVAGTRAALTTISTEAAGDLTATVCRLGNLFGSPRKRLKLLAWDHNVVAVIAASNLAAVCTMAEGLRRSQSGYKAI